MEVESNSSVAQDAILEGLRKNMNLLNDDDLNNEINYIRRALAFTLSVRKNISPKSLYAFINSQAGGETTMKEMLLNILKSKLGVSVSETSSPTSSSPKNRSICDYYLAYLVAYKLFVANQYSDCNCLLQHIIRLFYAKSNTDKQMEYMMIRIFQYYIIVNERIGKLDSILDEILEYYRISCVYKNLILGSCLCNCILRIYVVSHRYSLAHSFIEKAQFPPNSPDNQFYRYCYYKALISTVLTDYNSANHDLTNIIRRCGGMHSHSSLLVAVHKLLTLVRLLFGEVHAPPDAQQFQTQCAVYNQLNQIVMRGDVVSFQRFVDQHASVFRKDGLLRIAQRLHSTVIRIGLVNICRSYSCLPLSDVCRLLKLQSPAEAEFTIMRNIRDGIIHGHIDFTNYCFISEELTDSTVTETPQIRFAKRIGYALTLKSEIVKANV